MGDTTLYPATPSLFSAPVPVFLQSHTEVRAGSFAKQHYQAIVLAGLGPQAAHCIGGGMAIPAAMLPRGGQGDAKAGEGQALSKPAPTESCLEHLLSSNTLHGATSKCS